jgi:hypothetical protein
MKMSKMGATCQLRKDSKGTRVLRLVSLNGLGKVVSGYLRVSEFQSFYCLDLLKHLKRGALKRPLEIYLFKTQVAPELRRLLGSFDQKGNSSTTDIVRALLLTNQQ